MLRWIYAITIRRKINTMDERSQRWPFKGCRGMSYEQRLQIQQLKGDEFDMFEGVCQIFYGFTPKIWQFRSMMPLIDHLKMELGDWRLREESLVIPPTSDEVQAGIDKYYKEAGMLATADAIAQKRYHSSITSVLQMPYSEIYSTLSIWAAGNSYSRRLQKVYEKKK